MKRCPQCEFIYEDEQNLCDMDGKTLVHETRQPDLRQVTMLRASVPPKRSRLRSAVPLLAGLILITILLLAFYASPRLLAQPENATPKPATQNLPEREKLPDSEPATAQPETNPTAAPAATQSPISASINPHPPDQTDETEFASRRTNEKKANHPPKTTDSRLTISRRLPALPRVPPLPRLPAAKVDDKSATPGSSTAYRSRRTPRKGSVTEVTPGAQRPVAANQKTESRVGSFLKKTGRILSKPFKRS